jgi:HK97 family phage portal protein
MGWFKRAVGRFGLRAAKYAGIPLRDPALVAMLGNQPTAAGVDVDEGTAMNFAAVWQAVNIISANVAAMPAVLYRKDGQNREEATDHPVWDLLLSAPNDEMGPFMFAETITSHALTWGNGYAYIERQADDPDAPVVGLWPLMPNQTTPMRREQGGAAGRPGDLYYLYQGHYPGEMTEEYEPWEILHIAGLSFDGLKGYPVVQMARESIGLGTAMERYGAAFFGRGSVPGGIIEVPQGCTVGPKARKNLRESFELLHRGPDNAHRVGILEHGITYKALGLPPETAQFLQSRVFQIAEIARWFNIPPHLLRDLSHATYSNIEHQGIDFLVYTLRPWLIRWQQELVRKLFGPKERKLYGVEHDAHSLLLTDVAARYSAYAIGRNNGWLTLNDILRREKLPLLPAALGESRLIPVNMQAIGADGSPIVFARTDAVQTTALAGTQIAALLNVVVGMRNGEIDPDSAASVIRIACPTISGADIENVIRPYRGRVNVPNDDGATVGGNAV